MLNKIKELTTLYYKKAKRQAEAFIDEQIAEAKKASERGDASSRMKRAAFKCSATISANGSLTIKFNKQGEEKKIIYKRGSAEHKDMMQRVAKIIGRTEGL